jgi:hypothetical protein
MSARRQAVVAIALTTALLLAGCADSTEVITFTDEHGRVCTALAVKDSADGDREPTAVDCEYPPPGRTPGPETAKPLPRTNELKPAW